jgi:hypothetical protein
MAGQWGRFIWWLNQYSGAVQAITTTILVLITGWYAALTRRMAKIMTRQLSATFQPVVNIEFIHHFQGQGIDGGMRSEDVYNVVKITNESTSPLKLVHVTVFIYMDDFRFYNRKKTISQSGLVLRPKQQKEFEIDVEVDIGSTAAKYKRTFIVHCTDLAGVSAHSFSCVGDTTDITHEFGFFKPDSRVKYYWKWLFGDRSVEALKKTYDALDWFTQDDFVRFALQYSIASLCEEGLLAYTPSWLEDGLSDRFEDDLGGNDRSGFDLSS